MTKDQLLAEAASRVYTNKTALALAREGLSDSAAASRVAALNERGARVDKLFKVLRYLVFAIFVVLIGMNARRGSVAEFAVDWIGGLCVSALAMIALLSGQQVLTKIFANEDKKQLLEPIAGTEQCEKALLCLEKGGDMVAQWRDLALVERFQLHGFDFEVMQALCYLNEANEGRARYKAKLAEACRKVHGIPLAPARDVEMQLG